MKTHITEEEKIDILEQAIKSHYFLYKLSTAGFTCDDWWLHTEVFAKCLYGIDMGTEADEITEVFATGAESYGTNFRSKAKQLHFQYERIAIAQSIKQ